MEIQHAIGRRRFPRTRKKLSNPVSLPFDRKQMLSITQRQTLGNCTDLLEDGVALRNPETLLFS